MVLTHHMRHGNRRVKGTVNDLLRLLCARDNLRLYTDQETLSEIVCSTI